MRAKLTSYMNFRILDAAMHEAVPAIAACGVSPIVRIPDTQGWMIKRESDTAGVGSTNLLTLLFLVLLSQARSTPAPTV